MCCVFVNFAQLKKHEMNSIGKVTEDLINRSPFLREAMTDDLINISALARKLKPEIEEVIGKEVKEGAIVMAIKRMTPGLYHRLNVKITNVMGDLGDFLVRSNLTDFTYENSESLKAKKTDLIEKLFKTERLKSHTKDLASVTVKLPSVNTEIYGIYYYILKHLAWEGINIVEIVSTSNEFTVVVKQDDVDKAFKILMQLKRGH